MSKMNELDKLHMFDFWSMIGGLKWGDTTNHIVAAKRYVMKNFPPYKTNAFRRILDNLAQRLVAQYESITNSVYTYSQIYNGACEVIGYGQSEYVRYVNEPTLLSAVIESTLEKEEDEKFAYALPLEDDFYNRDTIV